MFSPALCSVPMSLGHPVVYSSSLWEAEVKLSYGSAAMGCGGRCLEEPWGTVLWEGWMHQPAPSGLWLHTPFQARQTKWKMVLNLYERDLPQERGEVRDRARQKL